MKVHLLLIMALTFTFSVLGQRRAQTVGQTSFGSETAIKSPTRIPRNVLEQLAEYHDGRLKQCQSEEFQRESNSSKHFAATRINLNGDRQPDLIVQAQTSCFMGAHSTTFWVFTEVEQRLSPGYDLAFSIAGDSMKILKTSSNGYRDIETASHKALELYTTVWKFDGGKYEPCGCTITDFRTNKVTRARCEN